MADCPGVIHLAAMADGGLARLRTPGGALTAAQARAVAEAAERLGSGVVDLTNRANLQIRGLAPGAGPRLAAALEAAGFRFFGEADRRRNILLDPFSGLDPQETRDLRPLAEALEARLVAAAWIEKLSPKFSFALDGGGTSAIAATPSDVTALARPDGILVAAGGRAALKAADDALPTLLALAEAAARLGPAVRAKDVDHARLDRALGSGAGAAPSGRTDVAARFGLVPSIGEGGVALCLPAPVGRLDAGMLRFLAASAEAEGDGRLVLAPWSAVVLPNVRAERAAGLLARSEAAGFTPVAVAERLRVTACSGAPACERAREPAKALGARILALASAEPGRLPEEPRRLHLSACPKGCAGSAPADLLLLGASDRPGWSVHENAAPRAPGTELGRIETAAPEDVLARLRR